VVEIDQGFGSGRDRTTDDGRPGVDGAAGAIGATQASSPQAVRAARPVFGARRQKMRPGRRIQADGGSAVAPIGLDRPFPQPSAAGMARAHFLLELEEIPPQPIERIEP